MENIFLNQHILTALCAGPACPSAHRCAAPPALLRYSLIPFLRAEILTKCTLKHWRTHQAASQLGKSTPRHKTFVVVSIVNLVYRRQSLGHSCEGLSR